MLLSFLVFIFSGCGTTVSFQVQKAPEMNTAGIKSLVIMPFETSDNTNLQRETAQLLTAVAISNIRAANYFTLIDHREIERLEKNGERIENHVDAFLTGQIIGLHTDDNRRTETRKDQKTGETFISTMYDRTADLSFSYRLIRVRDGTIIDVITRQKKNEDHGESRSSLKSVSKLLEEIVTNQLSDLSRKLAPYNILVHRYLMDEKSKDKELKSRMKDAALIVRNRNYTSALNSYLAINSEYGNVAAAYNAAVMHEAKGDIRSAIGVIETIYDETGNSQAREYLYVLKQNLREQERLASEYTDRGNQTDRVIAHATGEISRVLPRNAKLWVINNSKEEIILANTLVDGITSSLVRRGTIVVDRDNANLVEAEQSFQMSGRVSDDDFVSIGNAAGANTLVIVSISGVSSLRRAQLRVLDLESRTSLYQSDVSDNWKL